MASTPDSPRQAGAAPHCLRCRHYYITFDPAFPYGCRALEFKSRQLPCREVKAASGQDCQYFQAKPVPPR